MGTGFYLIDNPPRRSQGGTPRWEPANGMVGVHTTEGALDAILPDRGAENVANYIVNRSNPGSYHEVHDYDSVVVMAPDSWMTWHTAAANLNGPAWGISAACRSTEWTVDPTHPNYWWTITVIASMGRSIRAYWERNGYDVESSARWLTKDQARNRQTQHGRLYHHGVAQPEDRSDAWVLHPDRAVLDEMLVMAIKGSTPVDPDKQWEDELMGARDDVKADTRALLTEFTGIAKPGADANLTRYHQDDRLWMVPGLPFKAPGHPAVFVLTTNGDGDLVRRHVRSMDHLKFERDRRTIAAADVVVELRPEQVDVARSYPLTPGSVASLAAASISDI